MSEPAKTLRFQRGNVVVASIARALTFYRDVLGFELTFQLPHNPESYSLKVFDMPPDGDLSEEVDSLTVPCSEAKAVFNNLPVDRYYITAEGIDADDFTVVDNGASAETDLGEVLQGKESTANTVVMSPTPAQLWVRFALNKDMFQAMCSQISIASFTVTAYKNGGAIFGAIGYEVLSAQRFSIDLQGRLLSASYKGIDNQVTAASVGIGINWF